MKKQLAKGILIGLSVALVMGAVAGYPAYTVIWDRTNTVGVNSDGSLDVNSTDFDIRALASAQDDVSVTTVKPDGTNTMPSMDAVGRRAYIQHTDGTNSTPAMDVVGRAGYQIITDGADTVAIDPNGNLAAMFVDETGTAYGVKHIDNKPRVSALDYLYDIAEGNVSNHLVLNTFGHNATVGTSWETVWSPSSVYPYMSTADQIEVLSNDLNDDDTDTGAWTVQIYGLDPNWDEANETITMNGAGVVTTTGSYIRVFRAKVATAGTSGVNEGTITIRDQDTDTTRATIAQEIGQTLMAVWTVPDGYTFYMTSWYGGSAVTKALDIGLFVRDNAVSDASLQNKEFMNFSDTTFKVHKEIPNAFTGRTDIEIRAKTSVASGDIAAGFAGWYEL